MILMASSLLWLTGCGNVTLDGEWVQYKQVDSDGTVRKEKDLEVNDKIAFDGEEAVQTVSVKDGSIKDIIIKHNVKKISDTEYKLIAGGKVDFGNLYIKGNKFYIRIDTGIDEESIKALKESDFGIDVVLKIMRTDLIKKKDAMSYWIHLV